MAQFKTKFATGKQDWETPESIFEPLNKVFKFTLDVCATKENTKCSNFFTIEDNALIQNWQGICWMNPPFGEQAKWVKKAYEESKKGTTVVCLLPARTNTIWWHDYCKRGQVRFIKGRPKFVGAKYGLPQPLAIVIFGYLPPIKDNDEVECMKCDRRFNYEQGDMKKCLCGGELIVSLNQNMPNIKFTIKELEYIYEYLDFDANKKLFLKIEKQIRRNVPRYIKIDKTRGRFPFNQRICLFY